MGRLSLRGAVGRADGWAQDHRPRRGHSSTNETLCGRIIAALKSEGLLNESVGAGYIDRHWPPAFKDTGAWPLTSLRNSFLSGALTRLIDPDTVLRRQIIEFVERGDFGLASGVKGGDLYERTWYKEPPRAEGIAFESGVFLLTKAKAEELRAATVAPQKPQPGLPLGQSTASDSQPSLSAGSSPIVGPPVQVGQRTTVWLKGTVPPEAWNRLRDQGAAEAPVRGRPERGHRVLGERRRGRGAKPARGSPAGAGRAWADRAITG